MVQISHPYRATGKTIALTIQTFVGKAAFTIHSDLGAQGGKKSVTASTLPPSICHEVMDHKQLDTTEQLN